MACSQRISAAVVLFLAVVAFAASDEKPNVVQKVVNAQKTVQQLAAKGQALDAKVKFATAVVPKVLPVARKLMENNFALPKKMGAKFLGKQSAKNEEHCECQNWQYAYGNLEEDGVHCSQEGLGTPEQHVLKQGAAMVKGAHMCRTFFARMNNGYCVNYKMEKNAKDAAWEGEQWCYVSSKCTELKQGSHVKGTKLSWKMCDASDERTSEMSVEELEIVAKADDIDISLVTRMAYPTLLSTTANPLQKWKFAQFAWDLRDGKPHTHASSLFNTEQRKSWNQAKLGYHELQKSGKAMVIPGGDGGELGVVVGHRAYSIQPAWPDDFDQAHPHSWSQIQCVAGCSQWGWSFNDQLVDENGDPFDKKLVKKHKKHVPAHSD